MSREFETRNGEAILHCIDTGGIPNGPYASGSKPSPELRVINSAPKRKVYFRDSPDGYDWIDFDTHEGFSGRNKKARYCVNECMPRTIEQLKRYMENPFGSDVIDMRHAHECYVTAAVFPEGASLDCMRTILEETISFISPGKDVFGRVGAELYGLPVIEFYPSSIYDVTGIEEDLIGSMPKEVHPRSYMGCEEVFRKLDDYYSMDDEKTLTIRNRQGADDVLELISKFAGKRRFS